MREALVGPYLANLMILVAAAAGKLARPEPFAAALGRLGLPAHPVVARLAGVVELVMVGVALVVGAAPLVVADLGIVAVSVALAVRAPDGGCGCFGATRSATVGATHLVVTGAMLVVAVAAALAGVDLSDLPSGIVPMLLTGAVAAVLAWLLTVALTGTDNDGVIA